VGVENRANVVRSLKYLKEVKGINPEMIVTDLSPNLLGALSEVMGEEKIAIDPFHVMQDVNRAILKDLTRFRIRRFTSEQKDLMKLKNFICMVQSVKNPLDSSSNPCPEVDPKHEIAVLCRLNTVKLLKIHGIQRISAFFTALEHCLAELRISPNLSVLSFAMSLEAKIPKNACTQAGMTRLKAEILKKLKTLSRDCCAPLKDQQTEFNKQRWAIFYQPERLTPERAQLLCEFLQKYPELEPYRDLTLSVGSIYRLPPELVTPILPESLPDHEEWGNELHACIKTFKRWASAIVRFKTVFGSVKKCPKRLRANMEYQNPLVKRLFRTGNNMKGLSRIEKELQLHLGGEVRNFLQAL
jgi:hypothetical protein